MSDDDGFERAFKYVVGIEGVYSNDPDDPGNWTGGEKGKGVLKGTKYGISAKAYPTLDIENLTLAQAKEIYRKDYWQAARCNVWDKGLAFCVFDCAVNQGISTAVKCLQRAASVNDDGKIGPHTLDAVARLSPLAAIEQFQAERILVYAELAMWHKYRRGWMRRVIQTAMMAP